MAIKTSKSKTRMAQESKKNNAINAAKTLNKLKLQDLKKLREMSVHVNSAFISINGKKFELNDNTLNVFIESFEQAIGDEDKLILTTQEVADLLNVSRPYIVKLIDSHQLPAIKVGNQRRVYKTDALAFQKKMKVSQLEALDELAAETDNLGIEYK